MFCRCYAHGSIFVRGSLLFGTVGLLRSDYAVYIFCDGVGHVFAEGWFVCFPYRHKDMIFEIL